MEARRLEEIDEEALKPFRRGWYLGSEGFRRKMFELMDGKLGENLFGELHQESAEHKAERIISEEMSRLGWKENDLIRRLKNDPDRLTIAARQKGNDLADEVDRGRLQTGSSKRLFGFSVARRLCGFLRKPIQSGRGDSLHHQPGRTSQEVELSRRIARAAPQTQLEWDERYIWGLMAGWRGTTSSRLKEMLGPGFPG